MTKNDFLNELNTKLSNLDDGDLKQIIQYYDEMISDGIDNGKNEETVVAELDTPDEIAKKIKESGVMKERIPDESSPYDYQSSGKKINKIVVEAQNTEVQIENTSSDRVSVHYKSNEREIISVSEMNETFTFEHRIKPGIFVAMGLFTAGRKIVLKVPMNFEGNIEVITNNAKINAYEIKNINIMQLKTSNAKIQVEKCDTYKLALKTSNGTITISDCKGKISSAESNNGRIDLYHADFETQCSTSTSNASISIDGVKSDNISLVSSNGSIKGTILGDAREYSINSHTSNASNSLPADWSFENQNKRLFVKTSNAKINISFLDK